MDDHLFQQGLGCPNCGEHRMRKLISFTIQAPTVHGWRRYKTGHHCLTCNHRYVPPPASELPPLTQQPLGNLTKGVLYYTDEASGVSVERARGVVTAVATVLMEERGILLREAMKLIHAALPAHYRLLAIPENWLEPTEEAQTSTSGG